MCKFFLCPLTWCTHTITHAHVQRVFSRQSSLEKTTTNKAPRRHWTTTAAVATTTTRQRQRSNRATIWLFSTLATMKFYFSFFVPVAVVYVCVFQLFFLLCFSNSFHLFFFLLAEAPQALNEPHGPTFNARMNRQRRQRQQHGDKPVLYKPAA